MARALIVGCGCRGRALAAELAGAGWAVRGTSRGEAGRAAIEAAGLEAALADPLHPGTLLDLVGDVAVVVFLLGSATGEEESVAAIHGPRLEGLMERFVDTPVRGVVYEGAGSVDPALLTGGAEIVRLAGITWHIPFAVTDADPGDFPAWLGTTKSAVAEVIAAR